MENIISMTTLTISNRTFSYSVRFSNRRRSVQIRVPKPDCLELAAPTGMPWPKIRQLVESKHAWILRQVHRLEVAAAQMTNATLTHGATLLYQGTPHTLLLLADGKTNALALAIDANHFDLDFIAHVEDFAGASDAIPRNFGEMHQAIGAVDVDECAKFGQAGDTSGSHIAFV